MIKVKVYWENGNQCGLGKIKVYTLKEFQELFNNSTDWGICDKINGDKIEFIVE